MRKLWIWLAIPLILVIAAGAWYVFMEHAESPIRVGILHSRTGRMAMSESSMIDAEVLALEEINARGGLLGRKVEWVIADGGSDWPRFAREARRLIETENVSVVFGCWTSASRKSVKPVFEEKNHLLVYPMAYEGIERSPNIVYTGAAPNQQIIPTVKWCYDHLKARRFFLVGSDYVWPRCVGAIARDQIKGLGAEVVSDRYVFFDSSSVDGIIDEIKTKKPDVVLSSLVGETNVAFYTRLAAAGVWPATIPIVSFSIAEEELRKLPAASMAGDYAAWTYFQSIERDDANSFARRFQARYGADRVVSSTMASAYDGVMLWSKAVEEADSAEVSRVRRFIVRQSMGAHGGVTAIDEETQHAWLPVYIGKIRNDGQFDVVWSSSKPVRPVPYPISRSRSEWEEFLGSLYRGWGGSWSNPVETKAEPAG